MEEEIINEFTSIKEVDESMAEALYEAGYTSVGDLNEATAKELSQVNGITDQLAESIKNEVSLIFEDIGVGEAVEEAEEGDEEGNEIETIPAAGLKMDPESQRLMKVRKKQKAKKPNFVQADQHKKKRLKNYWRRPKGLQSKKRRHILGKGEMAQVGYGSPVAVKGLHPSGFQDVLMCRVQDLDELDPDTQAVRIARTVGQRKRMDIVKKARSLGLKILNPPTEMAPMDEEVQ